MIALPKLQLIKRSEEKFSDGTHKWLAICGCGKEFLTKKRNVELGQTKSCGCFRRMASRARRLLAADNRPVNEDVILPTAYYRYSQTAAHTDRPFALTLTEFETLVTHPCHYCDTFSGKINGVDRKDSDQGYTVENTVSCCSVCNYLKGSISYNDFKALIAKIYLNLSRYESL